MNITETILKVQQSNPDCVQFKFKTRTTPKLTKKSRATGKHYVNGTNWLMESDSTPGKFYVALSRFSDKSTKYLVNGVDATQDQIADIKANYLPKQSAKPCLVPWRTYGLDSLVSVEAA